jgi:phosphoribosylcarboxyaminoimidazole (NCAIR) mutase
MGIGKLGFKNAIFFALKILGIKHPDIREKLVGYISKMRSELIEKKDKIERFGVWKYIEEFMK